MKIWKTIYLNLLNYRNRVEGIREICKRKWIQWRAKRYISKGSSWQKQRIRMRSNFRPNIRLATNILLVIGTFAIALKIAPIAVVYQEKKFMY